MYKYGCEYEVRIFSFQLVSFRQTQSHGWCGRNGKDLYSDTTKKTATSYEVFIYQRKVCFLSLLAKFISSLGKDFLKGSEWCFLTNNFNHYRWPCVWAFTVYSTGTCRVVVSVIKVSQFDMHVHCSCQYCVRRQIRMSVKCRWNYVDDIECLQCIQHNMVWSNSMYDLLRSLAMFFWKKNFFIFPFPLLHL